MYLKYGDETLQVKLSFLEKILSLHGNFEIPLEDISSVSAGTPVTSWKELRMPGTYVPGLIKAGTYYTSRGKEFWYTTRNSEPITIELEENKYKRLVLSVDALALYWVAALTERSAHYRKKKAERREERKNRKEENQ